ncbi:hypothetical protein [Nonomuraea africana]|uniref:Uncharacterized protein n=1 Tax=Nonomuraea africana TaxID=46171 RepID=A0ABR9KL28_9ACTN|nr:hypothetical protein [Nonomuraea africana]MBE1562257.1 hypothetical protein [Nonomuraea africana]
MKKTIIATPGAVRSVPCSVGRAGHVVRPRSPVRRRSSEGQSGGAVKKAGRASRWLALPWRRARRPFKARSR